MAPEGSLPISSWGKGIEPVYCWNGIRYFFIDCYGRKQVHWIPGEVHFWLEVAPEPSWLTLHLRSWDWVRSPLPSSAGRGMNSRAYGLYLPSCLRRGRRPPWVFRALLEAAWCSCVWPFNSQTLPEGEQRILILTQSCTPGPWVWFQWAWKSSHSTTLRWRVPTSVLPRVQQSTWPSPNPDTNSKPRAHPNPTSPSPSLLTHNHLNPSPGLT